MKTGRPYTYVVLRYRHDSLAGEFANIGVLLHEPGSGFLDAKFRHRLGRVSRIFPDLDGDAFKSAVRSLERSLKQLAEPEAGDLLSGLKDAGAFGRRILPDDDSSFIWSLVGSGLTANPVETLDKLYIRFVGRYDEAQRNHRDDAAIWKPVRDRLAERNLINRLQTKVISSAVDNVEFEHAWKNGAWHCYQPLSFDLSNEESIKDKARRWAGHILALKDATERFRPYFLVGSPSDSNLRSAYHSALGILRLSPRDPQIIEENEIDDLVSQIEDEVRAHDAG